MKNIKIFGTNSCIYCLQLKNKLIEANIEHEFVHVDQPEGLEEFKRVFNASGVDYIPQVQVNGKLLAPNKTFNTIDQAFELIKEYK